MNENKIPCVRPPFSQGKLALSLSGGHALRQAATLYFRISAMSYKVAKENKLVRKTEQGNGPRGLAGTNGDDFFEDSGVCAIWRPSSLYRNTSSGFLRLSVP
jgi:hypothetical protein